MGEFPPPNPTDGLQFRSGGFELYVPPTAFSLPGPPHFCPPHFVMLDDQDDILYDVDYESKELKNTTPWVDLELHKKVDPAIVFPSVEWQKHEADKQKKVTGFLVSIQSREGGWNTAIHLGTVHVVQYQPEFMNWAALESLKGSELPAEMKDGLLRKVFNRRPGSGTQALSYVNSLSVLDGLPRPWHRDGQALNYELDERFVGCKMIAKDQKWKLLAYAK